MVSIRCDRIVRPARPHDRLEAWTARSAFSFLEGASLPEDMIDRAAALDIEGVALLDRDCVSGAVRFHKHAVKKGVRAWIGAEVTAAEGFRYPLIAATRCRGCHVRVSYSV